MDTIPTLHHVKSEDHAAQRLVRRRCWLKPPHVDPAGAWLTNDAANHRLVLLAFPGISDDVDKDGCTGHPSHGF